MSSRLFYEHTTASLANRFDFDADQYWEEAGVTGDAAVDGRAASPSPRSRSRSTSRPRTPTGKVLPPDYNPADDPSVMSSRSAKSFRRRKEKSGQQFDGEGRSVSPSPMRSTSRPRSSTAPGSRSTTPTSSRYSAGQDTPIRDYSKTRPKSSLPTESSRKGLTPPLKPRTSTPSRNRPTPTRTPSASNRSAAKPRPTPPVRAPSASSRSSAKPRPTPVRTPSASSRSSVKTRPPVARTLSSSSRSATKPRPTVTRTPSSSSRGSAKTRGSSRSVSTPKPTSSSRRSLSSSKKNSSRSVTPLSSSKASSSRRSVTTPPLPTKKADVKENPVKDTDDADLDDLLGDDTDVVAPSPATDDAALDDILGTPPADSKSKAPDDDKPKDTDKSKAPDEKPKDEDKSNDAAAAAAAAAAIVTMRDDSEQEIVFDMEPTDSPDMMISETEPKLEDKVETQAAELPTEDTLPVPEAQETSVEPANETSAPREDAPMSNAADVEESVAPVEEDTNEAGNPMVVPLGVTESSGDAAPTEAAIESEAAVPVAPTAPTAPTNGASPDALDEAEQHPDTAADNKSEKSKKSVAIVDPVSGTVEPEDDGDGKSKKGLLQSILKTEKDAAQGTQRKRSSKKNTRPVLISCKYNPSRGFSDFQVKKHKKVWQGLVQYEKSKLEAKALAQIIIEELFERDFWPGKHWEIDTARVWENTGSEHPAFNAEKLATWDWKDIYSEASATAVIRFLPDRILIENYAYYVAG